MPFGAEFRCDICGTTSVLIIDRALVPLGTIQSEGKRFVLRVAELLFARPVSVKKGMC